MRTLTITIQESLTLTALADTLRPDWNVRPSALLRGESGVLPEAKSFEHAVRSLTAFATARKSDGSHRMRTPNLFTAPGSHWRAA